MAPVIVFGPTGQTGSFAALKASEHGAEVWLAMRNTDKEIPLLDDKNLPKVQADLDQPSTVKAAVEKSGAKRAFVYLSHGTTDHMKGTFEALKAGGVEFVVFLSSFTIPTDKALRDVPASELIPWVHAQAEASLNDVFGEENYVALRPGAFASNLLEKRRGIAAGKVPLYGGSFQQDNIVPADIGRVAGTVLVNGAKNGQRKIYLYGPEVRSIHDSILKIGETLGKVIEISEKSRQVAYDEHIGFGLPPVFAEYMCEALSTAGKEKGSEGLFPSYHKGVRNVELYTGRASTTLEDFVKENRAMFSA